jgi:hypothetical protein
VDRADEVALRRRKQTETFPMATKKFELETFTREEWLAMDIQTLEDQLEKLSKEYSLSAAHRCRSLFFNSATHDSRKKDGNSYKPSHWFRHFCKNWKGGKRDE